MGKEYKFFIWLIGLIGAIIFYRRNKKIKQLELQLIKIDHYKMVQMWVVNKIKFPNYYQAKRYYLDIKNNNIKQSLTKAQINDIKLEYKYCRIKIKKLTK